MSNISANPPHIFSSYSIFNLYLLRKIFIEFALLKMYNSHLIFGKNLLIGDIMKSLGYMEGTDPKVLTTAIIEGYETLPLSNGWDNHGKNIAHITNSDNLALVIGYLHKFIAIFTHQSIGSMLAGVKAYNIPMLVIVPKDMHDRAGKYIKVDGIEYKFVDPADISREVLAILSKKN